MALEIKFYMTNGTTAKVRTTERLSTVERGFAELSWMLFEHQPGPAGEQTIVVNLREVSTVEIRSTT